MEFSWPPEGGNKLFYEWISSHSAYYPKTRWEYSIADQIIRSQFKHHETVNILDVGCGSGNFLQTLDYLPLENRCGLDFNESALTFCREMGFTVFQGSLEKALNVNAFNNRLFQIVTSFHCLEHVEDPIGFMRQLSQACSEHGSILVSTPASPMSIESNWFNPLNQPPHHLTKWNLYAYRKLAEMLNLKLDYYYPKASPVKQALTLLRVQKNEPTYASSKLQTYSKPFVHPIEFLKLWRQMLKRARSHPLHGADVILVEMKKSA